jgi:CHAD domain-containing protein
LPKRIHWDDAASAAANARAQLPALMTAYFEAGRKLLAKATSPEDLHRFRLRTKRTRYTLELFRLCYGPGLDQRLSAMRGIQTMLGEINDCDATRRLLARSLSKRSLPLRRLERFLGARSRRLATAFRKEWRESFDAPGREEWWTAYLGRGNGAKGRPR